MSQRLVAGKYSDDAARGLRLLADRLERGLARTVRAHLTISVERGDLAAKNAGSVVPLSKQIEVLGDAVFECIDTVTLGDGTLYVDLSRSKIASSLQLSQDSIGLDVLTLERPFAQRRRGVETRLMTGAPQPARDDTLIDNVARAEQWRAALSKGDNLATIAARDGITEKYLGQMLCFAFLSPKLVRAILEGRQPPSLTTNWLRCHILPMAWADQDRIAAQL